MTDINKNIQGALDKLPTAVRHAVLLFAGSLLAWAAAAAQGAEVAGNPIATAVLSSALVSAAGTATLWFTNLTKQYGVGAN
jgi:hypothetical protein